MQVKVLKQVLPYHQYYNQDGTLKQDKFTMSGYTDEQTPTQQPQVNKYINHSGGAIGSDYEWGQEGQKYGVTSNHYYHGAKTPHGNIEITEQEFEEGKQHVMIANRTLHRRPERYLNLLASNYMQVKNSDAVFAIGHLVRGIVDGGTGWAVQMAIDDGKPVYVYDQQRMQWYKNINGQWSESETPTLTTNFAGIGTRQINEAGKQAIKDVYRKTFDEQNGVENNNIQKPSTGYVSSIFSEEEMRLGEQYKNNCKNQ